ncbi:MAG: SDR family oxidoreductase [Dehalococcoidales bacterium]|nr:SDR family oxidoreductase [Dehalococcoidales bacterium]
MAHSLEGKVAVLTGAGSKAGIGRETAKTMAALGAKIVINDMGKDPEGGYGADRVVKEITDAGGVAVANYDPVGSFENGKKIIQTAIDNFGRIDILINTAGNFRVAKSTIDFTEDDWNITMDVHLNGLFACTHAALKHMLAQESGGRIINFTSMAAFTAPFRGSHLPYNAAKAGVIGFTRALALEMKEHGITVNAISPGAHTSLFPVDALGPEYVSPLVTYLALDEAKDITSQIIFASGGIICVLAHPTTGLVPPDLDLPSVTAHGYLYKDGIWTLDELSKALPVVLQKTE